MELIFFSSRFWKKVFELQSAPFRVKAFSLESLLFFGPHGIYWYHFSRSLLPTITERRVLLPSLKLALSQINFLLPSSEKIGSLQTLLKGSKKTFLIFNMKKKVQYLIAAIFLLKQEKKRFYIVYSLSWVGKKT